MTCGNCGTDNPGGAQFCGNCGASLAAGATPPTEAIPPVPPAVPPPPVAPGSDPTLVGGIPPVPPTDATTTFAVPPPAPPPPEKRSRKALLLGLLALLVAAAAVGSFLVFGDDDEDVGSGGGRIVLEPIGSTLRDDFAGNLDLRTFDSSIANLLPDVPPLGRGIASVLAGLEADGDTPGLYGGTRDQATCDVEQLVDFLTDNANEDKAEAWAEALGIEVDEIEDFVAELTPVRLRFDTRVTNHGFVDGDANAFQSVLEAGTAVLVDDEGVPRVKCNCGNPLAEPQDLGDAGVDEDDAFDLEGLAQNPEDQWDEFDPEQVVVVEAGDAVDEFVLVDIDTGELFARPVGTDGDADTDVDLDEVCELLGDSPTCDESPEEETTTTTAVDEETTTSTTVVLGTGDVQVTLQWFSNADLDLAVTDPTGEQVSFGNRGPTATGGQLDVDSNIGCPDGVSSGVENVFWPPSGAPAGAYSVEVTGFSVGDAGCGGGDYILTIRVAGVADQVIRDSVAAGETDTFDFVV